MADSPTTTRAGQFDDDIDVKSSPHAELMKKVAGSVAPWCEKAIRRDERFRVATLLYEGKDSLADFAGTKAQLVKLISFMLNLDGDADA